MYCFQLSEIGDHKERIKLLKCLIKKSQEEIAHSKLFDKIVQLLNFFLNNTINWRVAISYQLYVYEGHLESIVGFDLPHLSVNPLAPRHNRDHWPSHAPVSDLLSHWFASAYCYIVVWLKLVCQHSTPTKFELHSFFSVRMYKALAPSHCNLRTEYYSSVLKKFVNSKAAH